jgi:transcriptional regulator with XRE-family HTH domain
MSDSLLSLDYGEQLVKRYRTSGLTRKEFAERSGISVSTLAYYVRRERKAASPSNLVPNRIVPVDLIPPEENPSGQESACLSGGIAIRLASGLAVEVGRGFDAGLLRDVLAVLGVPRAGERG